MIPRTRLGAACLIWLLLGPLRRLSNEILRTDFSFLLFSALCFLKPVIPRPILKPASCPSRTPSPTRTTGGCGTQHLLGPLAACRWSWPPRQLRLGSPGDASSLLSAGLPRGALPETDLGTQWASATWSFPADWVTVKQESVPIGQKT